MNTKEAKPIQESWNNKPFDHSYFEGKKQTDTYICTQKEMKIGLKNQKSSKAIKHLYFKTLIAIACLLVSSNANAYDFTADGIYYKITSEKDLTCSVTPSPSESKYSGTVTIPSAASYKDKIFSVTSIGSNAFYECSELTSVTIPNSVTSVDNNAFFGCIGLKNLRIEDGSNELKLGNTSNFIHHALGLFFDCPLESIYLGRNLIYWTSNDDPSTAIETPFYDKDKLTSLVIGNNVTSIGYQAFYGCSDLTSVTIPNNVTLIEEEAFNRCSGLKEVNSLNPTAPKLNTNTFDNNIYINATLNIPVGSLASYQGADGWKNFLKIVEKSGLNNIEDINKETIKVITNKNEIEITGTDDNTHVEIFNTSGLLIYNGADKVISISTAGIYIVKIAGKTFKVII